MIFGGKSLLNYASKIALSHHTKIKFYLTQFLLSHQGSKRGNTQDKSFHAMIVPDALYLDYLIKNK